MMTARKTITSLTIPKNLMETVARPEGWLCVEWWYEEADAKAGEPPVAIHIVPNFGPEHDFGPEADCWCHPPIDCSERRGTLVVEHNVAH